MLDDSILHLILIMINLGAISDDKGAYIRSLGYKIINWNIDTVDWESQSQFGTVDRQLKLC